MTVTRSIGAKINILLDVLGKRPDGYHTIRTLFLPLSEPHDTITVGASISGMNLSTQGIPSPSGPDNLVWRTATAFAERTGQAPSWSISLGKSIPVAAGLGGGSADAAATLLALNEHSGGALSSDELHEVASSLGADIPFFLHPVPSVGEGIGECLTPIELGCSLHIALLNPGFPVPVQWSYENLAMPSGENAAAERRFRDMLAALKTGDLTAIGSLTSNDLEAAIRRKFPIVEMMIELLKEEGCVSARVSGSGPTVYGIGEQHAVAEALGAAGEYFGDTMWRQSATVLPSHL